MKKILIHADGNRYRNWLKCIADYYEGLGYKVVYRKVKRMPWLWNMDHVFMCHGEHDAQKNLKRHCEKNNIPYTVVEIGFFPQKNNFFMDHKGINARSFIMDDDLSWVNDAHLKKLDDFSDYYLGGRRWSEKNRYIFVPLQLAEDSNIVHHSTYESMQDFISETEKKFKDRKILFKMHPLDTNAGYRLDNSGSRLVREGNILDLAVDAEFVYGINSTSLLETAMMGVPTTAVGEGLLKRHKGNERKLLAALVDQQIPVGTKDLSYWIETYSGERFRKENHGAGWPVHLHMSVFTLKHYFRKAVGMIVSPRLSCIHNSCRLNWAAKKRQFKK